MRTTIHRFAGFAAAALAVTAFGQTSFTNAEPSTASENMTPSTSSTTTTATTNSTNSNLNAYAEAGRANMNHFSFGHDVVGYWDAVTTMWSAPGAAPQTSTAKASFLPTPGMGGRFVSQTFESDTGEQKFFGNAWFGFNNTTERYEFVWIDNTTTNILFSYGTRDESGAINFTGSFADPLSGQKRTTKSKFSWPEKGKMTFEMWSTGTDGTEFKSLEVNYTKGPWPNPQNKPTSTPSANANPKTPATPAPAPTPDANPSATTWPKGNDGSPE